MSKKNESKVIISIRGEGTAESEVFCSLVGDLEEWKSKQPIYLKGVLQNVVRYLEGDRIERMSDPQLGVFINGYTNEEGDWEPGVYELKSVEIEGF